MIKSMHKSSIFVGVVVAFVVVVMMPYVAVAQVNEPEGEAKEPVKEWVKLTPEEYIYKYRNYAIENRDLYGIPVSITMGQAILESGFGNGYLARVANNHFCIKCKSTWTGPTITHSDDDPNDCFRVYESVEESFRDHAEFLSTGKRYESLFAYDDDDYKSWAHGLKKAGYATAADYAERLINTIERYHLQLLDGKDGVARYDEYIQRELGLDFTAMESTPEPAPAPVPAPAPHESQTASMDAIVTAYAERGVDPNNFRVTMNAYHGYNVYLTNGAHYVVAKYNDSYERIGELFEVHPLTLRKFNDVAEEATLKEGDIVYIERKAARWKGDAGLLHTVAAGENLYIISQLYGVRLPQLSKLNRIRVDAELMEGQTIRLR